MKRFLVWICLAACSLAPALSCAAPQPNDTDVLATLRAGHPRLLLTNDELQAALTAAKTDPFRAALHARIIALATAQLNTTPIKHVLIGPRLLDKSRTCIARVLDCAMAYRLTGDTRFSDRAKRELLTAAAFDDWNPSHFLDIAEMSFAFAIGYDWLYDQLTPDERATIKRALLEKSLVFAPAAYGPNAPTDKRVWFVTAHHNWNQVCNGGLLAAALALADEQPDLARLVITGARKSLPLAMAAYQPDGAYPEGPGYWGYGTTYNVIAIALLQSALGHDLGLSEAPAFNRTALFRLYAQSPDGLGFNYADGEPHLGAEPAYSWLAERFHEPLALAHSRSLLEAAVAHPKSNPESDRFFALHAIWFPQKTVTSDNATPLPLDVRFRGPVELAFFRSRWNDPRALFVGFKAGHNDVNHAHLDLGSFVLDADGVRWAEDLGPDDYNLPGYFGNQRWTYFRLNNHSHNTLTPGNRLQDPKAVAPILAFATTPSRAFAIADLSEVYPGTAKSLRRGIAVIDRSQVLVQDEAHGLKPHTKLTWQLVTGAKVKVLDAHHAVLTADGRELRAEILAPADGRFSAAPATPPTAAEKQNSGTTRLFAETTPETNDATIAVALTPVGDHWPASAATIAVTPLDQWK